MIAMCMKNIVSALPCATCRSVKKNIGGMPFFGSAVPRFCSASVRCHHGEKRFLFSKIAFRVFLTSEFSSKTDVILKKDMVSDKKYIVFSAHRVYNIRGNK